MTGKDFDAVGSADASAGEAGQKGQKSDQKGAPVGDVVPRSVCVIGGGSFGTAMACVAAEGVSLNPEQFNREVKWYVRRDEVCKEINSERANKQYWSGKLPDNLKAISDVAEAAKGADVCIVALPSEFLGAAMEALRSNLSPDCLVVSLVKSLRVEDGRVVPYSRYLAAQLPGRKVAALMGPNLYKEMARGDFAEATVGAADADSAALLEVLFETEKFHVTCISDLEAVDMCGCMKNTITLACGFAVGCGWGGNVKAAIIRHGLLEIEQFLAEFLPSDRPGAMDLKSVLMEACGLGDLMLSCTYGRGQALAASFVGNGGSKTWAQLEDETMNGMKIPDWHNVQEVFALLNAKGRLDAYPLLAKTYAIAFAAAPPESVVDALRGKTAPKFSAPAPAPPAFALGLAGKVAVVTGAANGIGHCIATSLVRHGVRVFAMDRDEAGLKCLEEATGGECHALPCDLSNIETIRTAAARAGEVDLLVNAAGVAIFQQFGEQTPEVWDLTMDINARAAWFLLQELSRGMKERGGGAVVNISSQSSTVAVSDKHLVYSTSKAAMDHITRCSAYALAKSNIRVNAVNPTVVRTELAIKAHGEEGLKKMAEKVPLGRICEPQDVADMVLYLLSDRARMITGTTCPVDGGFLAARP